MIFNCIAGTMTVKLRPYLLCATIKKILSQFLFLFINCHQILFPSILIDYAVDIFMIFGANIPSYKENHDYQ